MRFIMIVLVASIIQAMDEQSRQVPSLKSLALSVVSSKVVNHASLLYDALMPIDQLKEIVTKQAKNTLERGAISQLLIRSGFQKIPTQTPCHITLYNEHLLEIMHLEHTHKKDLYKRDESALYPLITIKNTMIRNSFNQQTTHGAAEFYIGRFSSYL